jgi:hypothetical protein
MERAVAWADDEQRGLSLGLFSRWEVKMHYQYSVATITFKRWLTVLFMAFVCGGIVYAIPQFSSNLEFGYDRTGHEITIIKHGLSLLIWLLVALFSGSSISPKQILKYPPSWIAIVGGYTLFRFFQSGSLLVALECLIVHSMYCLIAKLLLAGYTKISNGCVSQETELSSSQNQLEWVLSESPVKHITHDRFDRKGVAGKIVSKLRGQHANVALLGVHGAGKSSLINWVVHDLQHPDVVICRVDSWGRRKSGFSSYLLKQGISALSSVLDVMSLVGVPARYANTLSSSGLLGRLYVAEISREDPLEVLLSLDEVLSVMGKRLVFIIEDVDRNHDEELLMVELPSFLDRLSSVENMSFLLSITAEEMHASWLLRIATTVDVGEIDEIYIAKEIQTFRTNYLRSADVILPMHRNQRQSFPDDDLSEGQIAIAQNLGVGVLLYSISRVVSNPRRLKVVLKETYEAWEHLNGEIYIDDVLVLTALKVGIPEVYQFILQNEADLRRLASAEETGKIQDSLELKLKPVIDTACPGLGKDVDELFNFIFCNWKDNFTYRLDNKPQSIVLRTPSNYWNRLRSYQVLESPTDQECLNLLSEVCRDLSKIPTLVTALYGNKTWQSKVEQFWRFILNDSAIQNLGSEYLDYLINSAEVDKQQLDFPALSLVQEMLNSRSKSCIGTEWWLSHIFKASEVSLAMAYRILSGVGLPNKPELADNVLTHLRTFWEGKPERIGATVSYEMPYALYWIMVLIPHYFYFPERIKAGETDEDVNQHVIFLEPGSNGIYYLRPSDWTWMVEPLLKALEESSDKLLPMIACILVKNNRLDGSDNDSSFEHVRDFFGQYAEKLTFVDKIASGWFGDNVKSLAELYSKSDITWPKGLVAARYLVCKKWAEQYLEEESFNVDVSAEKSVP